MDEMKWELLVEAQGRLEANLIQSYLEAQGIPTELFQEAVGHHIYPVVADGLGLVQIFAPKEKIDAARELLAAFEGKSKNDTPGEETP